MLHPSVSSLLILLLFSSDDDDDGLRVYRDLTEAFVGSVLDIIVTGAQRSLEFVVELKV
jgi:hypothetical protein